MVEVAVVVAGELDEGYVELPGEKGCGAIGVDGDWPRHSIEVYCRAGALLVLATTLGPGDILASPILPGFTRPLNRLFVGIPLGTPEGEDDGGAA